MKEFWNERFSSDTYLYGEEPNPHFKEFIDNNHKGNILLPGEGEGRNAVYAAFRITSYNVCYTKLLRDLGS